MRAIVQLVSAASVTVDKKVIGSIGDGLLTLIGVSKDDSQTDADFLAKKIVGLRIFPDQDELMNRSLLDIKGQMLIVSQFTLYGDCRKGRRPSYNDAAAPEQANALYEYFIDAVNKLGIQTQTGQFQALMQVKLINEGPVTIMIDSKKQF
nr:D-tyrosyl-tRNA(Tyr) deacylase [Desulfobulbaceae bacterium]